MNTQTKSKTIIKNLVLDQLKQESVWKVILFNCYCHTYDEAVEQIMATLKCGYAAGSRYADNAQKYGNIDIYEGSFSECTQKANILGATGLDVKITQ